MSAPISNTHLRVPRGFGNILEGLAREVLRDRPKDIPTFAALYFSGLLKDREESGLDPADWGARLEDRFYNNRAFKERQEQAHSSSSKEQTAGQTGVFTENNTAESIGNCEPGIVPAKMSTVSAANLHVFEEALDVEIGGGVGFDSNADVNKDICRTEFDMAPSLKFAYGGISNVDICSEELKGPEWHQVETADEIAEESEICRPFDSPIPLGSSMPQFNEKKPSETQNGMESLGESQPSGVESPESLPRNYEADDEVNTTEIEEIEDTTVSHASAEEHLLEEPTVEAAEANFTQGLETFAGSPAGDETSMKDAERTDAAESTDASAESTDASAEAKQPADGGLAKVRPGTDGEEDDGEGDDGEGDDGEEDDGEEDALYGDEDDKVNKEEVDLEGACVSPTEETGVVMENTQDSIASPSLTEDAGAEIDIDEAENFNGSSVQLEVEDTNRNSSPLEVSEVERVYDDDSNDLEHDRENTPVGQLQVETKDVADGLAEEQGVMSEKETVAGEIDLSDETESLAHRLDERIEETNQEQMPGGEMEEEP